MILSNPFPIGAKYRLAAHVARQKQKFTKMWEILSKKSAQIQMLEYRQARYDIIEKNLRY